MSNNTANRPCLDAIPGRRFTAWSEAIGAAFATARTVKTGKPAFRLTITNEAR